MANISTPTLNGNSGAPYERLVQAVMDFQEEDDGIQINQKLRLVQNAFAILCQTGEEFRKAVAYIYEEALSDTQMLQKLMRLISLKTFTDFTIDEMKGRDCILKALQTSFSDADNLFRDTRMYCHFIVLFSGFVECMTRRGEQCYWFLNVPVLSCLQRLLRSTREEDAEFATTKLFIFACTLQSNWPTDASYINPVSEKYLEIAVTIRTMLVTANIGDIHNYWLQLASDLINGEFRMLPDQLIDFYESKLGRDLSFLKVKPSVNVCSSKNLSLSESENVAPLTIKRGIKKATLRSGGIDTRKLYRKESQPKSQSQNYRFKRARDSVQEVDVPKLEEIVLIPGVGACKYDKLISWADDWDPIEAGLLKA